ncbi:MAG: hypothetical protein PHE02_11425 [Lachnospiraceae bacterium]|nr:hypothetical protein [Lachnospiraceae bacterium]
MIYYFHSFPKFSRQIEYTFRNIFCILKVNAKRIDSLDYDFDKNDIVVIYTDKTISLETKYISIMNSKSLFGEHYGSKEVMDNISVLKKSEFVSLFREPGTKEIHNFYGENCVQSNMDLIADIFFTLTRYEEYEAVMHSVRDEFKRYRIENSILFKNDLIRRPIVDEQIELLKKMLIYLDYKIVFRNGAYLFVSHDIDSLRKYHNFYTVRTDLLNKIVWGKFTSFLSLLIKILCARKDPYFNIISIIKKEKKIKINSSFYFMHNKSKNNADYNFESKRIQKLIREMNRYNVEMGYHVSIDENIREMKKHVSNHNKSVELEYGAREHYLQVNPPLPILSSPKVLLFRAFL